MSDAMVSVVTSPTLFPPGTVSGGISITLIGGDAIPAQIVTVAPYTATFLSVPAGTYVAVAQAIDSAGGALGAPVDSAPFTITVAADVSVDIPSEVTVSVT